MSNFNSRRDWLSNQFCFILTCAFAHFLLCRARYQLRKLISKTAIDNAESFNRWNFKLMNWKFVQNMFTQRSLCLLLCTSKEDLHHSQIQSTNHQALILLYIFFHSLNFNISSLMIIIFSSWLSIFSFLINQNGREKKTISVELLVGGFHCPARRNETSKQEKKEDEKKRNCYFQLTTNKRELRPN